jgi:hypothetical protein
VVAGGGNRGPSGVRVFSKKRNLLETLGDKNGGEKKGGGEGKEKKRRKEEGEKEREKEG